MLKQRNTGFNLYVVFKYVHLKMSCLVDISNLNFCKFSCQSHPFSAADKFYRMRPINLHPFIYFQWTIINCLVVHKCDHKRLLAFALI